MKTTGPHGLLVLDKPGGMTSRAAMDHILRQFPRRTRMGHTGTLDPLATGVLVLCLGNATRLVEYVQQMGKTYRTLILLGANSDTDDADGMVEQMPGAQAPSLADIQAATQTFVGSITQVPPAYSAAKVTGKRAYDLARQGKEVQLAPRTVRIDGIDICNYDYPGLELEIRCGKGTYIRSLARDLGQRLGCGGLVHTLRRTRVGPFTAEQSVTLQSQAEEIHARLLHMSQAVVELPRLILEEQDVQRLSNGQTVRLAPEQTPEPTPPHEVSVFATDGTLVAIALLDSTQGKLSPTKVLVSPG